MRVRPRLFCLKGEMMKTEIEVKFCDVDIDDVRTRLKKVKAVCEQPMRLMHRRIFEPVNNDSNRYLRIRDENDKVTMTYKQFDGTDIHGAKESEIVVSDFETAVDILERIGLQSKSYQESRRETWRVGEVEVVIDEWPWIQPFVEIEGESENAVKQCSELLGFDWNEAIIGSVAAAYRRKYPSVSDDMVNTCPEIMFEHPVPREFKAN